MVFCEEDENSFSEEGVEFWSCSNGNAKLKSSLPAPNVWVEESNGKEKVKVSSPSGFPNKFPEEDKYYNIMLFMLHNMINLVIIYQITVYCTQ